MTGTALTTDTPEKPKKLTSIHFELDKASVGKRIKKLRDAMGFSQDFLAQRVGKSRPSIGQWEIGGSYPSLSDFVNLARVLESTPDYIAFGTKPKPVPEKAPEGVRIPVMDYSAKTAVRTGELIVGRDFYARLATNIAPKITAFVALTDGLLDGSREGDVLFIDERATEIVDGAAYLTQGPWNQVIKVAASETEGVWNVTRAGSSRSVEVRGAIPVVGRVVGTMSSKV